MSNVDSVYNEKLGLLKSEDPAVRREVIEEFISNEINEQDVMKLVECMTDPDKGVRDALSFTLIYNGCQSIPKHVTPFISSKDISVRNLAGEILLKIGEGAIADMTAYLQDCNDDDKKFIIDIMGLIGIPTPLPDIIRILKESENDNVVLACIEAFGNLKAEETVSDMVDYYSKNELFKPTIIETLGNIGSKDALDFVSSKYAEEDELTKFSIIETMGKIGNEETFYFLLSEMNIVDGPLIWPIVASIFMLKEKFGLDLPFDEKVRNGILYTLSDADTEMKKAAANLIIPFDDTEIISSFLKIYGQDPEIDEIAKQKVLANKAPVLQMMIEMIKSKTSNVKNLLWLVREMIDTASPEEFDSLSALDIRNLTDSFALCLESPDEEVRKSAMELLFQVSIDTAILFIDVMAADDNVWNRIKLTELIENIDSPSIDEVLKKLSEDSEEMVKERAEWILSQRGIN